jgi:hypothetical protein
LGQKAATPQSGDCSIGGDRSKDRQLFKIAVIAQKATNPQKKLQFAQKDRWFFKKRRLLEGRLILKNTAIVQQTGDCSQDRQYFFKKM